MSESSGHSNGGGPDFHLPDEILSVIPTDPYDQLDLARKITSMAIASRVSNLESDMGRIEQKLDEKDRIIYELGEKVSGLNHACQEAESRLKNVLDENVSWVFSKFCCLGKRKNDFFFCCFMRIIYQVLLLLLSCVT